MKEVYLIKKLFFFNFLITTTVAVCQENSVQKDLITVINQSKKFDRIKKAEITLGE